MGVRRSDHHEVGIWKREKLWPRKIDIEIADVEEPTRIRSDIERLRRTPVQRVGEGTDTAGVVYVAEDIRPPLGYPHTAERLSFSIEKRQGRLCLCGRSRSTLQASGVDTGALHGLLLCKSPRGQ